MTFPPTSDPLSEDCSVDAHIAKIRESGVLARSKQLNRLLDFLHACHNNGRAPKEFEIAVEGLGRGNSFDVTQDALVRVYVHKLRRKLDEFYQREGKGLGARLAVPKGEYRLVLEPLPSGSEKTAGIPKKTWRWPTSQRGPWFIALVAVLCISLLFNLFSIQGRLSSHFSPENKARASGLWQPLFADDRPIVVVVGDYYIYAETDGNDVVKRLVRDFDINSPTELANHLQGHPEQAQRKFDVGLSYLPTSAAYAINKLGFALNSSKKPAWGVILASELTQENLRNSHIVYIGHLSGLGILEDLVFANSGFRVGRSYDELTDTTSGQRYASSSGIPNEAVGGQNHLAYLSSFNGPSGNRIIIVAGCRDAGLRELSDVISSENDLNALDNHHTGPSFEALYQTSGFGLATTPAKLLLARPTKPRIAGN